MDRGSGVNLSLRIRTIDWTQRIPKRNICRALNRRPWYCCTTRNKMLKRNQNLTLRLGWHSVRSKIMQICRKLKSTVIFYRISCSSFSLFQDYSIDIFFKSFQIFLETFGNGSSEDSNTKGHFRNIIFFFHWIIQDCWSSFSIYLIRCWNLMKHTAQLCNATNSADRLKRWSRWSQVESGWIWRGLAG